MGLARHHTIHVSHPCCPSYMSPNARYGVQDRPEIRDLAMRSDIAMPGLEEGMGGG